MPTASENLKRFLLERMGLQGIRDQKGLAETIKVTPATMSGYFTGSVVIPPDKVERIVKALKMDDAAELKLNRLVRDVHADRLARRQAKQGAA